MNVFGYTEDRRYALVLGQDNQARVHTVHNGTVAAMGRWECTVTHLGYYEEVYRARFPVTP